MPPPPPAGTTAALYNPFRNLLIIIRPGLLNYSDLTVYCGFLTLLSSDSDNAGNEPRGTTSTEMSRSITQASCSCPGSLQYLYDMIGYWTPPPLPLHPQSTSSGALVTKVDICQLMDTPCTAHTCTVYTVTKLAHPNFIIFSKVR
jgi:hypothetical protein